MIRHMKIAAAGFIGLFGLFVFLGNLFNISSAYSFVSAVMADPEQPYYKIIGPTVGANWLIWTSLFVIMGAELVVGLLGMSGALRMIGQRAASPEAFHAAKAHAVLAGVTGMLIWYGLFIVVGEGYFQMWQTDLGLGAVNGAFRYGTVCAMLMFFVVSKTD